MKLFKKRLFGIPVVLILFFVFSGIALAAWFIFRTSIGNIIGVNVPQLEYSSDGVTWTTDFPTIIDHPTLDFGLNPRYTFYLQNMGGQAVNHTLLLRADCTHIQGEGMGQDATHELADYALVEGLNKDTIDIRQYILDLNSNGVKDYGDLCMGDNSDPAFTHSIPFNDGAVSEWQLGVQLLGDAQNHDDLMGDSVSFDLEFTLR